MKKSITILSMMFCLVCASAQVKPLQTYKNPHEYVASHLYYDHRGKYYELYIQSNNQYEDRYFVRIKLGKSADDAVQSLLNILDTYQNVGQRFTLKGYEFGVRPKELHVYNTGKLAYAAGEYNLHQSSVSSAIFKLLTERGATMGAIRIYITDSMHGELKIIFDDYHFDYSLKLYRDLLPYLSHDYAPHEKVSIEDISNLKNALSNGSLRYNQAMLNICSQLTK